MQQKENVYEGALQTETVARATEPTLKGERAEDVSTVLGKFKDVNALAKAYGALEAEFTRRSQKLKTLERLVENLDEKDGECSGNGVEKLRANAAQRREEGKRFDDFVSQLETANVCAEKTPCDLEKPAKAQQQTPEKTQELPMDTFVETDDGAQVQPHGGVETENRGLGDGKEIAVALKTQNENGVLPVEERCEKAKLSHDQLLEEVRQNEHVRLKIIGEYLSSLGKGGAPLMQGGAGTLAAPLMKPKSVNDAGNMALHFFKKEGVQA